MEGHCRSRSASATPSKPKKTDYHGTFLPFVAPTSTAVAPHNRFSRDEIGLAFIRGKIDESLAIKQEPCAGPEEQGVGLYIAKLLHIPAYYRSRLPTQVPAVKDIMAAIDGTTSNPIDLTDSQHQRAARKPLDLLKTIPVKYLKFIEDVRPPYIGTYTRLHDSQSISNLARNPCGRGLPNTNYDYDSEAEWEEPAEGEDLDSEGEEEPDEDDAGDDMDGFLDDEEVTDTARAVKRRPMLGDQEPKSTGLRWEGSEGLDPDPTITGFDLRSLKLDILMGKKAFLLRPTVADVADNPQLPIDPYCSTYWQHATSSSLHTTPLAQGTLMEPPRLPLHPINRQNTILASSSPAQTSKGTYTGSSAPMKSAKAQRLIAPELMDEFKTAVQGSDLNKLAIVEILKKQ